MAKFTPLDAILESRALPDVEAITPKWHLDWACPGCKRYGSIIVEITGGPMNERTGKPNPKTDDEEVDRRFYEAHRKATSGLCAFPYQRLRVGLLWRWQKTTTGVEMVVLPARGEPPPKEYRWPPRGL